MAENKKSFVLYCDLIHTVEKLSDIDAGLLFKHTLRYVNDKNPHTDNQLVDIVFESIKQALKRDLKKWENRLDQKSEAGINSAFNKYCLKIDEKKDIDLFFIDSEIEKFKNKEVIDGDTRYIDLCIGYLYNVKIKLTKSTNVESVKQSSTKSTVSDNVSVSDNVNDINNIYQKFVDDVGNNRFDSRIEAIYSNLKIKKGSLTPLIAEFKNHLIIENRKHKDTNAMFINFSNWLNKIDTVGKLNSYKTKT